MPMLIFRQITCVPFRVWATCKRHISAGSIDSVNSPTLPNADMVGKPVWQVCEVLTRFNGSDDSDYSVFISYPNGLRDYAFECSDSQLQLYNFLFAL